MAFAATELDGAPAVTLQTADGARIAVLLRGGQLLQWRGADGVERLYCSPQSPLAGAAAVRGGVPVIFPQFGTLGNIGRHGFARTAQWRLISHTDTALELGFDHMAVHRPEWPHDCVCRLRFTLSENALELRFSVRNTGATALQFTAALHTYFALPAAQSAVLGLLPDGAEWPLAGYQDRMIHGAPTQWRIQSPAGVLHAETEGFADLVVWNPGENHGLADLPADGHQHFACVEPANLTPVTLEAGLEWVGRQLYRYSVASTRQFATQIRG